MGKTKLVPPCSYQGGKQRLAKQIVDIIFEQNEINDNTKFYDLCCGSGAITLELINRGVHPNNITMVDASMWGDFWKTIGNDEFDLSGFKQELDKLPDINNIQSYLKSINNKPINEELATYHFIMQQAGSFGSKFIDRSGNNWVNSTFRNYWKPTATSNRKSPVNPMMPMPNTLYERIKNVVEYMGGCVRAIHDNIENIEFHFDSNSIVYIDPPYKNTSGYNHEFDYETFILNNFNYAKIYVSEGGKLEGSSESWLLSKGRDKGNISGDIKKKPVEEWLSCF